MRTTDRERGRRKGRNRRTREDGEKAEKAGTEKKAKDKNAYRRQVQWRKDEGEEDEERPLKRGILEERRRRQEKKSRQGRSRNTGEK